MRKDDIYVGGISGSEQLDTAESLAGEIGQDPLDSGYNPPDLPPYSTRHALSDGTDAEHETLELRLAAEEPEFSDLDLDAVSTEERAGRLVLADPDASWDGAGSAFAEDVGRAGWAFSAEEAAVLVIEEDEYLDEDVEWSPRDPEGLRTP